MDTNNIQRKGLAAEEYYRSQLIKLQTPHTRGVTGNFFRGAKSLFLIFCRCDLSLFPVEISILADPEKVPVVS